MPFEFSVFFSKDPARQPRFSSAGLIRMPDEVQDPLDFEPFKHFREGACNIWAFVETVASRTFRFVIF